MQEPTPPQNSTFIELRFGNRSRIVIAPNGPLFPGLLRIAMETFELESYLELSVKVEQQNYIVLSDRDIQALVQAGILKDNRWTFEVRDTTPARQPGPVIWRSPTAPAPESSGRAQPTPRFAFAHEQLDSVQLSKLAQRGVQGPGGVYGLTSLPQEITAQLPGEVVAFLFKQ